MNTYMGYIIHIQFFGAKLICKNNECILLLIKISDIFIDVYIDKSSKIFSPFKTVKNIQKTTAMTVISFRKQHCLKKF